MNKIDKVVEAFQESQLHLEKIDFSLLHILPLLPLTVESYKALVMQEISYIDQFLFRFIKLQDLMGKKLFGSLLEALEEDISEFTMRDMLNRLEFLKILEPEEWLTIRGFRNGVAHEYPGEEAVVVESINSIVHATPTLVAILRNCGALLGRYFENDPLVSRTVLPPYESIGSLVK